MSMSPEESLNDVAVRQRQLEAHILRSAEYLNQANRQLKRQISMLYLAICLLFMLEGFFIYRVNGPVSEYSIVLTIVTAVLACISCLLLLQTRSWMQRINDTWLNAREKEAIEALRARRLDILNRQS
jgi:hypothetical protein